MNSSGNMVKRPTELAIGAMLAELRRSGNEHMVLQRLDDELEGDWFIQVLLRDDNTYELEYRAGSESEHYQTRTVSQDMVRDTLLGWAADKPNWRSGLMWNKVGHDFQIPT
ncbi:hypothetical protein [Streptomyces sp. NBC_00572]|uniref:hypothetical protein n=1 Tax=Streptomyces sp. NBC_00572 TaxID=2903664 RepID=UPI002259371E|nr:hypothetical protein [Streptomyces sp. NBC_00572]MCX4983981.1 hypothetical protein [Streptomyces sp. NBC_00572]